MFRTRSVPPPLAYNHGRQYNCRYFCSFILDNNIYRSPLANCGACCLPRSNSSQSQGPEQEIDIVSPTSRLDALQHLGPVLDQQPFSRLHDLPGVLRLEQLADRRPALP
eukprot:8224-Hanusia_phi.AAC.1